ncbi:MAG: DUF294 nucleotidyltransferase-like domain-containing protein [Candidatus Nezhaarchaeota archaeon]|nr:DUF294 nucleotidyltransferase-like domain-containing protein [Candidatus Nezhaarchaeota archaeon]
MEAGEAGPIILRLSHPSSVLHGHFLEPLLAMKTGVLVPPPEELEDLKRFLKTKTILGFLDDRELSNLLSSSSLKYYPRGSSILEGARRGLYVVYRGAIKVVAEESEELLEEGDVLSVGLLVKEPPNYRAEAVEDTICVIVDEQAFWGLYRSHHVFAKLMDLLSRGEVIRAHEAMPTIPRPPILYERCVTELVKRPPVTCSPSTKVKEAARIMSENHVSSIIVVDELGRPVGIVTDADLRRGIAILDDVAEKPVELLMSRPVVKIDGGSTCWEALVTMAEAGVKHLPVVVEGRVAGVITLWDISSSLPQAPVVLIREIQDASSVETLRSALSRTVDAIKDMHQEGVRASHIAKLISYVYDKLVSRAIQLAEEELLRELSMHPPVKYAWIAMGSEGRQEQLLKTDQDSALMYEDPPPGEEEVVDEYFRQLAIKVSSKLLQAGFPKCPHGFTADNPALNKPLKSWLEDLHSWLSTLATRPENVMMVYMFADSRLVYGSQRLVDEWKRGLIKSIEMDKRKLQPLARNILIEKPPLGFLGRFVVHHDGNKERVVDIKVRGINILMSAVKVLSLDQGVEATNTFDRLRALASRGSITQSLEEEASFAYNFLLSLKLREQLRGLQGLEKIDPSSLPSGRFIHIDSLSKPERTLLREAFKTIRKLQTLVNFRFAGGLFTS